MRYGLAGVPFNISVNAFSSHDDWVAFLIIKFYGSLYGRMGGRGMGAPARPRRKRFPFLACLATYGIEN